MGPSHQIWSCPPAEGVCHVESDGTERYGNGRNFHLSFFGGASEKWSSVGIFSLVQSDAKTDSSSVVSSCLTSSIEDCMVVFMVALMDELMEEIVALSCFTSFWVSRNPDCKVLK